MFIEIEKDILEDALGKADHEMNRSRDLLVSMALSALMGKHYVVVPELRTNQVIKQGLAKLLGKHYVSLLSYAIRKNPTEVLRLKSLVCIRSVITYNENTPQNSGVIYINPAKLDSFEPWTETFVLTENLIDSSFYAHTVRYFKRRERIIPCNIAYYPLMGGGVTMNRVLENEITLKQHFCLAIADSDKKYPEGKIGDTALQLLNQLNSTPFNSTAYVLEKVMEIENLIPNRIVLACSRGKGFKEILCKDPSFYDMKKGLSLKCLFNDKVNYYWKNMLPDEIERFQERDEVIRNCSNEKEYLEKVKDSKIIKEGFGSDLLTKAMAIGNTKHGTSSLSLYCVEEKDLNSFQEHEWFNIGKIMFSWTCAIKAI